MMSNQTVHKLKISLLNYIINMTKSATKPIMALQLSVTGTLKIFLTATSIYLAKYKHDQHAILGEW